MSNTLLYLQYGFQIASLICIIAMFCTLGGKISYFNSDPKAYAFGLMVLCIVCFYISDRLRIANQVSIAYNVLNGDQSVDDGIREYWATNGYRQHGTIYHRPLLPNIYNIRGRQGRY